MADVRKLTLELLRSYEEEGRYVNLLLSSGHLRGIKPEEHSIITALLYTTVENKLTYDYFISAFSARPISDIDPFVRDVLRIGICQIVHMESVPDFAAVNETVRLARHKGEAGFINAVLRRVVKNKNNLPYPDKNKNLSRFLSIFYSIPQKTVKMFMEIFGEECEDYIKAVIRERPLSLTVNQNKISAADFIARNDLLGAYKSENTDMGVMISEHAYPADIPGYSEGEFFVQDEASRIAVLALGVSCGDTVVDVCAAPGGKSFLAAIVAGECGRVYSFDIHESKLSLIRSGAERLGLSNINVAVNDATLPRTELYGAADRVICDVPCSGLGVFSKKPDLRYKDVSEIAALPTLQYEILEKSAVYLKTGGYILYSTCTVNPAENEAVTDKFIAGHPEFSYEPVIVGNISAPTGRLTLLPHKHNTDGFYIAKLRKNK